jgi:hypothetical protein
MGDTLNVRRIVLATAAFVNALAQPGASGWIGNGFVQKV